MRDSTQDWQKILAQGFSTAQDLLAYLHLPAELGSNAAQGYFKTRVPRGFAAKIEPRNPYDPLLLQVLATDQELEQSTHYHKDPLQEANANPIPGVIHKYHNRLLLTLTGVCAINCRFCFRRHFPYADNNPGQQGWQQALDYIAQHPEIHEVILSGGDPLLASDLILERLLLALEQINHVKIVRFHSRVPIVLPERLHPGLITLLTGRRFRIVMVFHCNHPHELDEAIHKICKRLIEAGCLLLNQSVLLKGVNDDSGILSTLSHQLFEFGILPYYLHLLDPVEGAKHFDLDLSQAQSIYQALQTQLPGYLVPKLAREQAGVPYKMIMSSSPA